MKNAIKKSIEDLFYDDFFRDHKGYTDWSDEEIAGSINQDDYKEFGVWLMEQVGYK